MNCYIIHFTDGIDYGLLEELDIHIVDNIECAGCIVAELDETQIKTLKSFGLTITKDSKCSI